MDIVALRIGAINGHDVNGHDVTCWNEVFVLLYCL